MIFAPPPFYMESLIKMMIVLQPAFSFIAALRQFRNTQSMSSTVASCTKEKFLAECLIIILFGCP